MLNYQVSSILYKIINYAQQKCQIKISPYCRMPSHQQDFIRPKQPIWVHKSSTFKKAIIQSIQKQLITSTLQTGQLIHSKRSQIYQRNPFEQQYDESRYDLMDIDVINQPQVLENVRRRFAHNKIHSFVQNTLLVVNPYHFFQKEYHQQVKQYYLQNIIHKQLNFRDFQPHVYSITSAMISQMLTSKKSQAIIISGESGAGKTQANKQCLRFINYYYQHLSGQDSLMQNKVQKAIQISNPILQGFGNSKTIRNNNSSRFGKYLRISLNPVTNSIKHAQFSSYLLQKSRLISRSNNEQNFHIFYQFINNLTLQQKLKYQLVDQNNKRMDFQHFNYLKRTDGQKVQYTANRDVTWQHIKKSIIMLPGGQQAYQFVCTILAVVLHLGNLQPYIDQIEDKCQILPQSLFKKICILLNVNQQQFHCSLTSYHIKVGQQTMTKFFGIKQVTQLIHSLSKCLYQKLFNWIIQQLNVLSSSFSSKNQTEKQTKQTKQQISLGFLDIYGFEVLENNSLEQLFINYTNERLHQIYLQKIFKHEKEVFQLEGLMNCYHPAEFQDNLKIIELIDYNTLGIFNLLDEWCSIASPDESSFISKLRYNHKKHQNFPGSNFNLPSTLFRICHTPKDIDYSVIGFRQKNKDLLRSQIRNVLKQSSCANLSLLFHQQSQNRQRFLSTKYRQEMNLLMNDIVKSQLYFIRCIKSNANKQPNFFQQEVVFTQISYLGILDTIKIKKMGHCVKLNYQTIDRRFKWLVRYHYHQQPNKSDIQNYITNFIPRFKNSQILYGKNQVFFKDFAYSNLVKKYNTLINDLKTKCHKLISLFIKNIYLKKKQRKRAAIKKIESYLKPIFISFKHQNKINNIKQIQFQIRKYLAFRKIQNRCQNIKIVQSYIKRTLQTRKRLQAIQAVRKITKILRKAVFMRKIRSRLVCTKVIGQLIHDAIIIVGLCHISTIQRYLSTLLIQQKKRQQLALAQVNVFHIMQQKKLNIIQCYMQSFSIFINYRLFHYKVIKAQCLIKSYLVRKKYLLLKKSTITIQRSWRQYLYHKKGSHDMFQQSYKYYYQKVKNQNYGIQSYLYRVNNQQQQDTIQQEYLQYLSKFKQKFSILYYIIDFQTLVDLDICYPINSWPLNYFRIHKDAFIRDNPIQQVHIAQTYSLAVSTNRLYLWGMNQKYNTLDNFVQIKTKNQLEIVRINEEKLQIIQQSQQRPNIKKYSTIKKSYFLDSTGKVNQHISQTKINIIKFPSNQRITQIACGGSHVVFQSVTKKIYTMGNGKKGQLGHGTLVSEDQPKIVKFPQNFKNYYPIQISASFSSTIILFNHKKLVWFGSNASLHNISSPQLIDLKTKIPTLSNANFLPIRIQSSWSKSLSIIGISLISFNNRLSSNLALRSKTIDILIQKWHQSSIQLINPPYLQSISDHFEECHIKLPKIKVKLQTQGKRKLKEMENKLKNYPKDNQIQQDNYQQFSFYEKQYK